MEREKLEEDLRMYQLQHRSGSKEEAKERNRDGLSKLKFTMISKFPTMKSFLKPKSDSEKLEDLHKEASKEYLVNSL